MSVHKPELGITSWGTRAMPSWEQPVPLPCSQAPSAGFLPMNSKPG